MNRFKQWQGTGLLLMAVAALSFAAARVTHTLPVGAVVWADSARTPHATALSPETSGLPIEADLNQSSLIPQEVETVTGSGEPATEIAPSISMPTAGVLSHSGTGRLSPLLQDQARTGGLTVSAVGSVTRPADEAYIIIAPDPYYGASGPELLSSEDKQDIIDGLAQLGIEESAIEFILIGRYDPTTISVEMDLETLSTQAEQVVEAVTEVVRQVEFHGVRYVLSPEHCHQALALARRQAIPSAQQAADDLAEAFGVALGSVTSVLEYPVSSSFTQVRTNTDGCSYQNVDSYSRNVADMVSLDSEQEVTVNIGLQITYSIQ